ncbi:single-stranded DNA-binding protein [Williamsoniiplasma lucivorax]|uniref:Single-stranded DNA-binding protein n=1 Tax=Williamsoniiplasma lucivorax TaxID=209274 RepID=A0A2S5RF43_9MOLU|nr:single-stranded DNA-binding protein [Williamsoniiplasma lucivorax]PPE05949.1 single-strand DNA-binding protein [Williamsoniiplasma lucivorax]
MNKVILIGRITKDIELKQTVKNESFTPFTIAVSEYRNGAEYTNFINCLAFNENAENMIKFLHKGSLICVEGKLSVRNSNKDGKFETTTSVTVERIQYLEPKTKNNKEQTINGNEQIEPEPVDFNKTDEELIALFE